MNAPAANPAVADAAAKAADHSKLSLTAELIPLVAPFMATADIRYYLNGINVRPHPDGGAVIAATNGHVLGVVWDREAVCEHEVILRLGQATISACAARRFGRQLVMRAGRVAVIEGTEEKTIQAGDPVIVATYPEYRNAIPACDTLLPGLVGQFNPSYIALLDKVAAAAFKKVSTTRAITFFNSSGDPMRSAVARIPGFPDFLAVLMPQAPSNITACPDWLPRMPRRDDLLAAKVAP